ncbi:short-chain dehydrogenase [Bdellovibrio bacteriovorus]|uniref:Short-chain dehydrogenase n=1 Tax=Bdellovibrio bacteriovorus TaxID=959 RepID=A0A161PEF7_BDEBC|nr:SDR family oxidoreductase [Bdellovibrio bacteriovorus]KYG68734.1 short-chain dehydrogenase [Bdellovibrio bacteriovorus]
MNTSKPLRNKIAVVAGATRGAGRGIATALGEAGATVICTGRTTRAEGSARSDYKRSETIEETAELVTSLGGNGIAIPTDHLNQDEVKNLADRISKDFGGLDILVNDIWGGEAMVGSPDTWNKPLWELDLNQGLRMLRLAVDTHLITSFFLSPLLRKPGGLLVEVTDGTLEYNLKNYRISVFYDLAKVSINRLGFSQGHELKQFGATAMTVSPGWLRSEMMLEHFGVTEANWKDAKAPPGFLLSESPRFVGRCIAAVAADSERSRWNQRSVNSGQLAKEYGVRDINGTQPDVWSYMDAEEKGLHPNVADFLK